MLYALTLCVRLMHVLYAVEAFHIGLVLTWSGWARCVRANISWFEHARYCRLTDQQANKLTDRRSDIQTQRHIDIWAQAPNPPETQPYIHRQDAQAYAEDYAPWAKPQSGQNAIVDSVSLYAVRIFVYAALCASHAVRVIALCCLMPPFCCLSFLSVKCNTTMQLFQFIESNSMSSIQWVQFNESDPRRPIQ